MVVNLLLQDAPAASADRSQGSPAAPGALLRALVRFAGWRRVCAMREQLAQLDDRMLRDIGFDPEEARQEAAKPFWSPCTLTRVGLH
ncbi:MAG TPA: DUF1127 domain-containing protein [Burkholderiaceae bacterium]|nr:DUF1127 domain-containing protein [Burkholderiaceae bacterium]